MLGYLPLYTELHALPSFVDVKKCQAWAIPAPLPKLNSALHRSIEAEPAMKQGNKPVTPPLRPRPPLNGVKTE